MNDKQNELQRKFDEMVRSGVIDEYELIDQTLKGKSTKLPDGTVVGPASLRK